MNKTASTVQTLNKHGDNLHHLFVQIVLFETLSILIAEVEATIKIKNYRVLLLNFTQTRKSLYEHFTNWLNFTFFGTFFALLLAQQMLQCKFFRYLF